jgi:hypothetical protein
MGATIAGRVPAQDSPHQLAILAIIAHLFFSPGEPGRTAITLDGAQALAPSADLVAEWQGIAFLVQGGIGTERYERGRVRLSAVVDRGRRQERADTTRLTYSRGQPRPGLT